MVNSFEYCLERINLQQSMHFSVKSCYQISINKNLCQVIQCAGVHKCILAKQTKDDLEHSTWGKYTS